MDIVYLFNSACRHKADFSLIGQKKRVSNRLSKQVNKQFLGDKPVKYSDDFGHAKLWECRKIRIAIVFI